MVFVLLSYNDFLYSILCIQYWFLRFNSLYDAGHTVVGVEVAEQALRDFFTENNMEYTVEKVNKSNACVYKVSLHLQIERKNQKQIITSTRTRYCSRPSNLEYNFKEYLLPQ